MDSLPKDLPLLAQLSIAALVVTCSAQAAAWLRTKPFTGRLQASALHVLTLQVPPLRWWLAACGGLTVGDALCALLHLALTAWVLRSKVAKWPTFKCQGQYADDTGCLASAAVLRLHLLAKLMGTALAVQVALLMCHVPRSNVLAALLGAHHATLIRYHRWVGWATTATLALHAGLYSYLWWGEKRFLDRVAVPTNLAGLLAALAGAALAATSTAWFRRCCYLAFRTTHVLAAPAYLALSVVHDRKMAYFITPAVALYAADAALRWWQWGAGGSGVALGGGDVDVVVVGGGGEGAGDQAQMVTLRLGPWQGGDVHAGDTVWLHARGWGGLAGKLAGHPFSVADVAERTGVSGGAAVVATVHAKVVGPWTQALARHARECARSGRPLRLQVEGPYRHRHPILDLVLSGSGAAPSTLVLVAGGIGVTPVLAALRSLQDLRLSSPDAPLPRVHLLFAARTRAELELLDASLLDPTCTPWLTYTIACTGPMKQPHAAPAPFPVAVPLLEPSADDLPASLSGRRVRRALKAVGAGSFTALALASVVGAFAGAAAAAMLEQCGRQGTCAFTRSPVWAGIVMVALGLAGMLLGLGLVALVMRACLAACGGRPGRTWPSSRASELDDDDEDGVGSASADLHVDLEQQERLITASLGRGALQHDQERKLEQGAAGGAWAHAEPGRPDLAGFLRRAQQDARGREHDGKRRRRVVVPVLVGGPEALWEQACAACARLGSSDGVRLATHRLTHSY